MLAKPLRVTLIITFVLIALMVGLLWVALMALTVSNPVLRGLSCLVGGSLTGWLLARTIRSIQAEDA